MISTQTSISRSRLDREIKARKMAEKILEEKSLELYHTSEKLREANDKLEILLNEKDSELKGVFQNINDAYLVIDLKGNILKLNDVAERFLGLADSKGINENILSFLQEEDYEYAITSFSKLVEQGEISDFTAKITTKYNEIKWVNINASIIYSKDNKPVFAQGIVRDITAQRERQQIVNLINNTAKSILGKEDINEIAWEISSNIANYLEIEDCVIYVANSKDKTLEQIAAFGEKEEQNDIKNKLILPFGKGIVGRVAANSISELITDTRNDTDYVIDDKERRSEITVPIISDGELVGIIDAEHENVNYFTKDHIDTIESIASLVALQLKSALNLRELKITQQKNKELLMKLSKSNEELQEYAHIVSHDLKSPLRSLAALSHWIKVDNLDKFDKDTLQNFDDMEMTLEKMEQLISDVLNFSKIDAHSENDEEVDLNSTVKDLVKVLYVPENVSIIIANKLPVILGDKIKFQQLFQNLISNAIKFNNKPEGKIIVDVIDENSFYKFMVKDNGIGIEKRHFDKIFKIFQSLKPTKDSTGIGLSIVKKIVNSYKGEIWLESEVNKGTTFYFTIKK